MGWPVASSHVFPLPGEDEQIAGLCNDLSSISQLRLHNLAGLTSVGGTMAVIQNASLVIALDSAPVHIAVGFGVRFVILYGATQPSSDGPYKGEMWCVRGGRSKELGKHDYRDSRKELEIMKRISTEEVVALVRKRLQDGAES